MVVLCFVVSEVVLMCSVLCWLVTVCVAGGVVLLFVRLGVLSDCGEDVSCLLIGLCLVCFCPCEVIVE